MGRERGHRSNPPGPRPSSIFHPQNSFTYIHTPLCRAIPSHRLLKAHPTVKPNVPVQGLNLFEGVLSILGCVPTVVEGEGSILKAEDTQRAELRHVNLSGQF